MLKIRSTLLITSSDLLSSAISVENPLDPVLRRRDEAVDLRDGGTVQGGMDVTKALAGLRAEIAPALLGLDAGDQAAADARMIALDGTPNKSRLGGNALIAGV